MPLAWAQARAASILLAILAGTTHRSAAADYDAEYAYSKQQRLRASWGLQRAGGKRRRGSGEEG
jgi:hypothetical protein